MLVLLKNKVVLAALLFVLLAVFLAWLFTSYVYIQNGQLTFGHVVARVGTRVLTEDDYGLYEKIYNGRRHCQNPNAQNAPRATIVEDLKKAAQVEEDAQVKKINLTAAEIDENKQKQALTAGGIVKLLEKCGWDDPTFTTSVRLQLLSQKLAL